MHSVWEADVIIVGAGPAGIAAAVRASESASRVVVLDESPNVGGQIWRHRDPRTLNHEARSWVERLRQSRAEVQCESSVVDIVRAQNAFEITAESRGIRNVIRARAVILATGARERFLPFPGWTLPGVVGVGGAQALIKSGMSVQGTRAVLAGSGPLLLPVAASLAQHGARVSIVAEQAPRAAVMGFALASWRKPTMLFQAARYRLAFARAPYAYGTWVTAARGDGRVEEVDLSDGHATRTIACDLLCAAFGLLPSTELARLAGCAIAGGAVTVSSTQETTVRGIYSAGESTGVGGMDLSVVEGEIAGVAAAGRPPDDSLLTRRTSLRAMATRMEHAFSLRAELRGLARPDTIVCRCEDVALGAIDPTWSIRQAKLYTRAGMGPCQGRVCGAALEFLYGWPPDVVRMPVEATRVSTLIANATAAPPNGEQGA